MRRFLALIVIFTICFIFTACGEEKDNSSEADATETEAVEPDATADGVTPEFKAELDSLEAFVDEYIAFMDNYMKLEDEEMIQKMSDFSSYSDKFTKFLGKIDAIDEESLSPEDLAYYDKVYNRMLKKLNDLSARMDE
ncbi:MAG TPA: hypothetical protein GX736_05880 [Mogibacterium sp.]|nr:hypothetical protein [Mogibacterium sp.]